MWELVYAIADNDFTKWNNTFQNLGTERNAVQKAMLKLWIAATAIAGQVGGSVSSQLSGIMLGNYLDGTGTTFTESSLTAQQLSSLEVEINSWTTAAEGKTYTDGDGNIIPHVNDVTTPAKLNIYGGDPTDKVVMVNFNYGTGMFLHNAFGRATLLTDSDGKVKKIIDDYDYYMGWEIDRDADGSAPGTPMSDDIIVTGHGRRDLHYLRDNEGNLSQLSGGKNAENAFDRRNPIESWLLMSVSGAYGNGAYESYDAHPGAPNEKGKPYPVNIVFP